METSDSKSGFFSKGNDLKNRIIFTVLILSIYRLGTFIPLAGIDPSSLKELMDTNQKGLLGMFNVFSGGADRTWSHMYTYSAHPGGAAAALKNIEIIERENLVRNAKERGEQLSEHLLEIKRKHKIVGDVRGVGLIQGLEFMLDVETKQHFDPSLGVNTKLTEKLMSRGLWLRVPAYIIPLAPPLIINENEIDQICRAIDESLSEVEKELRI